MAKTISQLNIIKQEKEKLIFSLPLKLERVVLPIARFHMGWKVQKSFQQHNLVSRLHEYEETFSSAVRLFCHLYRISPVGSNTPHQIMGEIFSDPVFVDQVLPNYGDNFSKTILDKVIENTYRYQEAITLPENFSSISNFYHSNQFSQIYSSIWNDVLAAKDKSAQKESQIYVVNTFDALLFEPKLLEKYCKFFSASSSEHSILIFKTFHLIAENIGNYKAYKYFIQICDRFVNDSKFGEILQLIGRISCLREPEILNGMACWLAESKIPQEVLVDTFLYSEKLFDSKEGGESFTIHCFKKVVNYLETKEDKLLNMEAAQLQYYLQKSIDFFIE